MSLLYGEGEGRRVQDGEHVYTCGGFNIWQNQYNIVKLKKKKESAFNEGDLGSIPGLGRSPGEGKGYPLQYSGLENSMDCIVHGITKGRTQLSNFHFSDNFTSKAGVRLNEKRFLY